MRFVRTGRSFGKDLGLIKRRTFLLATAAAAASRMGQAAGQTPNIVLIVAGSWRAQAVPWAGDENVAAPNLAKLAAEGVTFSRAYSCYSRLDRARLSLHKGVFPHSLAGPGAMREGLQAESPSMEMVLKGAGYRTATFTTRQAAEIVSLVHMPEEQPFFLEWILEAGGNALMERIKPASLHLRENVPLAAEQQAREDLAGFYARARTMDHDIGIVLGALDRPGLAENTIVVFTSYHGEQFGSHGEWGDDWVFEESMRIPLAIRYPSLMGGLAGGSLRAGARNDMLISQVDLMPTLLKWCGFAVPETVQGRDLSGLLEGRTADRPEAIYAAGRVAQKDEWRMLVQGYDKLVADMEGNVTHLYNLAEDPYEAVNLANVSAQQLKRDALVASMRVWMKKLGDGVDASGLKKR